jgi:hypothetical protein
MRGIVGLLGADPDYAQLNPLQRIAAGFDGLKRVASRNYGAGDPGLTRLFTARADGSDAMLLAGEGMVSHFDWCNDGSILAWARVSAQDGFFLFDLDTGSASLVDAERMPRDGHCSFSPNADRRFILNDTLPDRRRQIELYVYDTIVRHRVELGGFWSPPALIDDFRCDLHPRWSRDGRQACIDSAHEGSRQLYVVDIPRPSTNS